MTGPASTPPANTGPGERATPKRGPGPAAGMGPGGGRGPAAFMGGQPTEKSLNFKGSSRRLLGTLAPERLLVTLGLALAAISVTLSVIGPRLLGDATNVIFAGVIGARLPAGVTTAQAVARLRAQGHGTQADLVAHAHVIPGQGIDFGHVGQVLLIVLLVYLCASAASWLPRRRLHTRQKTSALRSAS